MTFLVSDQKMFRVLQLYRSLVKGVAFVPLIAMLVLTVLALILTLSPMVRDISSFVYSGGYFEVRTSETARAVLTSIVSGMISLTVFGFSMMIVVVNQAASNYSPKVVETLSSQRSNQFILGVNLGTIVFALIVMMHVDNQKADGGIPELAILVAMILAIYCLLLFVKFINNISNSVRINNIIKFIYKKTKQSIESNDTSHRKALSVKTEGWVLHKAEHSGYFQLVRTKPVLEILKKHDAKMKVLPLPGRYYSAHEPLFLLDRKLDDEVSGQVRSQFVTYHGEPISENPMYGFRQLREIAVKALSPGINDPGVAILCIEHLGELLSLQVEEKKEYAFVDEEGAPRIFMDHFDFRSLVELSLLPIKSYGKRDYIVLNSLLYMVSQIRDDEVHTEVKDTLQEFANAVIMEAEKNISDPVERRIVNQTIRTTRRSAQLNLPLLNEEQSTAEQR